MTAMEIINSNEIDNTVEIQKDTGKLEQMSDVDKIWLSLF